MRELQIRPFLRHVNSALIGQYDKVSGADLEIVPGLSGNLTVQAKKFLPICKIFDIFKIRTYLKFLYECVKMVIWAHESA